MVIVCCQLPLFSNFCPIGDFFKPCPGRAKAGFLHHSMIEKIGVSDRQLDALEFINYCKVLEIDPCKILESVKKP
jgi:hypothetical protein